jgi:ATP/maltotriose-dependent transcriptional regulator MalT
LSAILTEPQTMPCEILVEMEGRKMRMVGEFRTLQEAELKREMKRETIFPWGDKIPCALSIVRENRHQMLSGEFHTMEEIPEKPANPYKLTRREIELLKVLPEVGFDFYQAAEKMCISYTTVRTHATNLYQKTQTSKMAACYVTCLKAGYDI